MPSDSPEERNLLLGYQPVEKTVEKHRTNLMDKLKVRNVAGLVRLAVKFGLVSRDEKS